MLKEFGGKLYSAVFRDEVRDVLQRSLAQTRAQGVGLRLRLRLADVPGLADVPWEFLYDSRHNRFLAQSRHTPLVRYLDLPDPPHPLSVEGPLRLLVMISSPRGYPALDVEQEWDALTAALAQQEAEGQVIVERLAATMSDLRTRLRSEQFHVFHFIGHGFWHRDWHDGVLVMEDRNGRPHEVTGEDLGGLLSEYDQTRLAVLNACEGARSENASDPFAGMAQSLIQQGLPAVVAMQFEITDDAAIIFARELYAAISDGYPVEAALAEARRAILHEGNLTEWGTPVLYSRAPDGHLFDLTGQDRISAAGRRAREEATPVRVPPSHLVRTLTGHAKTVQGVAFSPDGRLLATVSRDFTTRVWDLATGECLRILAGQTGNPVNDVAFSPDGRLLATVGADKAARVWDLATGECQRTLTGPKGGFWDDGVLAVAFSPDGRLLATGGGGQSARVWDPATGECQYTLTGHKGRVKDVAFSPDGRLLATVGDDGTARLWDPATGERQRTLAGHKPGQWTGGVFAVAFSPDGRLLATGGGDRTARLWDAATGECQRILTGHHNLIRAVAFSPDGLLLATASADNAARLWDPATGECQQTLTGHTGAVYDVAFSPDGRLVATSSGDKTARLWA